MSVRGVLFDVDDTLVDTKAAFAAAVEAVTARFLPHLPAEDGAAVLTVWRRDDGGHFRAYTRGELDFRVQRRLRAAALQEAFGGPVLDEAGLLEWEAVFESAIDEAWRAHPDAGPAVAALQARGLRVGALSNHQVEYQVAKLARVGLAHVPVLVGIETLGRGKPDPRVFVEACRRLGTRPAETVYVGDELDVDAVAAVRACLRGVWLDRPGVRRGGMFLEDHEAARAAGVPVVTSLAELVALPAFGRSHALR